MKQWSSNALILVTGLVCALGLSTNVGASDSDSTRAEGRLNTTPLGGGLSEIVEWPCGPAEYFGFLANNLAAISCGLSPTADFAFVDLGTGNVVRQIEGPPFGIVLTSGLWTIEGEDYWAQVIGRYNLHLVMPDQQPEIRLYHPDPSRDRRLSLADLTDRPISDAYINGIAGCAILEERNQPASGATDSRMMLIDTADVGTQDQLRANTVLVDPAEFGNSRSRPVVMSGSGPFLSSTCSRSGMRLDFFVSEIAQQGANQRGSTRLSHIAIAHDHTVQAYVAVDTGAYDWTSFIQPSVSGILDLATIPQGSERLTNMSIRRLGGSGGALDQIADPLPEGWRWIYFDSLTATGLGTPRDYRSARRNLMYAKCEAGRCVSHELPVELAGASYFFGAGRLAQRQVFRACISMPDDSACHDATVLVSMPDLIID